MSAQFVALQEGIFDFSVPSIVFADKRTHSMIQLTVDNNGNIAYRGRTTFAVYISADGSVDSSAALLVRVTRVLRISPGGYVGLKIPMGAIPDLAAGEYSLVVQVTDANQQITSTVYSPITVQG